MHAISINLEGWNPLRVPHLRSGCGQHRTSRLARSGFSGCQYMAEIKQPKHNWEEQSCFQLNLAKNLLHDRAEAERKFADEYSYMCQIDDCAKCEFLLFLLIGGWTLTL